MTFHHKFVKTKLAALMLLSSLFFLMSCQTLDFPNPNAPIVDNVTIQSVVTGVESGMRLQVPIYLRVVATLGREAYYFEPADPRYTGELLFGKPDPGGFLDNSPWSARYRVVANCNFLLDKAKSSSGAEKAGVEAFAKTIMAYQLLLNLNYLDENGIKLDFSGNPSAPFASKTQAFAQIEVLLDEANASLAAAGSSFPFTLSNGFAGFNTPAGFAKFNRALKARVAIYQNKYSDALTALNGSFLNTAALLNLGVYHVYGTGLGDEVNPIYETPTAAFVKLRGHPTFKTQAEAGDKRYAAKILDRPDLSAAFDGLVSTLAVTLSGSSTDAFPIIRNEELILIRAEANIGLGNLAAAEADINLIRAAAGLAPVTLTAANAVDQLLHERWYSLFMEGHRWIDVRRYNKLSTLPIDRTGDAVIDRMPKPETES